MTKREVETGGGPPLDEHPRVTVVIPVLNEAQHIDACLAGLTAQTYPAARVEILVVDGGSTDSTIRLVMDWASGDARIRLLPNPHRTTAWAMNIGIAAATGEVIAAASGHAVCPPTYLERTVSNLQRTGAWSAGGAAARSGTSLIQRSIACATASPVGVGDAAHNYLTTPAWVESVFPGTWPRWVFERVGGFDPEMTFNEDNELSYRIRQAGGRIWFDPDIVVEYVPRASLEGLFRQYRRYARGRVAVLKKHRGGVGWRHAVPAVWVAWLTAGLILALLFQLIAVWLVGVAAYATVVAFGAYRATRDNASTPLVAAAIVTMHAAFGVGAWHGIGDLVIRRARPTTGPWAP